MNPMDEEVIRKKAVETVRAHINRATSSMYIGDGALGIKKGTLLTAGDQVYKVVKIDKNGTTLTLKPYRVISWLRIGIIVMATFTLGILLGQLILWWIQ